MSEKSSHDMATLRMLHVQIEQMCRRFKKLRNDAAIIAQNNQVPDAALHLNDVLKATEDATMTILDTATAISSLVSESGASDACKEQITRHIGTIYDACGFQDISGQRIRRVLDHLNEMEEQLLRLAEISKGQNLDIPIKDKMLQGPQLSSLAPSQNEIDDLFSKSS